MRLNLPENNRGMDAKDAKMLYTAATYGTTHSKAERTGAYFGGDIAFALPKMFDPSRRGMMGSTYGQYGGGLNILKFDEDDNVREKVLLGCRNIAKTHPVMRACHTAGAMVETTDGLKPIEEVSVGDSVRTHLGRFRRVTDTMSFDYHGDMVELGCSRGNVCIECTSGHPLYVFRRSGGTKYLGGETPKGDYMWVDACDVKVGDYLVSPASTLSVESGNEVAVSKTTEWVHPECVTYGERVIPETVQRRTENRAIVMNDDMFRLLGYFVADGHASKNGAVEFYFGGGEADYADDVVSIAKSCIGLDARVRTDKKKNMMKVVFYSTPVSEWLRKEFGTNAHNKTIPNWVIDSKSSNRVQFIIGFWRGDGCETKYEMLFDSVSPDIINGICHLLKKEGVAYSVRWPRRIDSERVICGQKPSRLKTSLGRVSVSGSAVHKLRSIAGIEDFGTAQSIRWSALSRGFFSDGYMHFAVEEKSVRCSDETVYNLEVEDDESYLVDGIASHNCVEVYSRYPLVGLKLQHDDPEYERFYRELFLEDLDFENFLTDVGKVFWVDGTAFIYGNWSDSLKLWVGEDIMDPINMRIKRVPFIGEDLVYMHPSDDLKEFARGQSVEGRMFREQYPEMAQAISKGEDILMSSDRLTMIANKDRPTEYWGTPVMLRAWNTLRLEDRMQSAMQATADRLYAPLVMFTVGGQLPNGDTFIPSAAMLDAFRGNLDAALASDFRAIVTHDGVKAQEVIRGDKMNNFKQDIDMYDERIFMAWGLTSSILKPQNGTYATTALEFQLASQLLASYQKTLVSIYNKQAAFVAEAHEHYEYEKKGEQHKLVYERKEMWDPDARDGEGAWVVKDVPKLSYPKMTFDVINFKDEQQERKFRMELRNAGMPIADDDIAIGVDIDLEASAQKYQSEQIRKKVMESERETAIFKATLEQGMTIPPDTKKYLELGIPPLQYKQLIDEFSNGDEDAPEGMFQESSDEQLEKKVMEQVSTDVEENDFDIDPSMETSDVRSRPEISDSARKDMPKP